METADHLDQSYSREQQGLGPDHEAIASPVALVRSFTSKSRSSSSRSRQSSRNRSLLAGVESSRAARLRELQKNVEDYDDDRAEKNVDSIEKVVSRTPSSTLTSRNGSHAPSEASSVHVGGGEQAPGRRVIRFEEGDPENPNNWGQWKKAYSLFVAIMSVMNSTINSSIIGGAVGPISRHFNEYNEYVLILPTSMYLIGYACGPMVWGPLSETHGRKGTMIWSFAILTIFCIASAVAPNFAALVVFRFLVGVGGSCAISVVGGVCADVYQNPKSRGRAMSTFMAATTFGPILGPPVSGFIAVVDWSWAFWVGAIFAGATWPLFFFFQETYGPAILKRRAERLRKETGDENIVAPIELEKRDLNHILTVVLTRPLRMVIFEPLVLFTCLYLSYAYSIFYIFLQSFPIIFEGIYGFNPGEMGLVFLAIGVGSIFSSAIYLYWDYYLERAQRLGRPWSQSEEMRRLPLACIAGPFFVISAFWLGWSAEKHVHWSVPVLAVVPFGFGYLCIFMALLNYLVDAYDIFAASAMAAASLSRSTFGAALPFAAKPMYRTMGVGWATSLLGFFSLALCIVPFVFVKWGDKMRSKSKFCQYLKQKKREEEEEREREARLEQSQVKGKEDV